MTPTAYEAGRIYLYHPCGVTNANFTNGEKYATILSGWVAQIESSVDGGSWTTEYSIPAPALASNWEAWNRNEALTAGSKYVATRLHRLGSTGDNSLEASDCTVTLNGSYTPTLTIGSEQGNYLLDATIENQTTGESIQVTYTMATNEELEIDTDAKTVTDLEDDTSQFQALELIGGARREWLRLLPGDNVLEYTQPGTNGVTVTVEWEERFY